MTNEDFNDRIARAKKSAAAEEKERLKELFGTDDPAEIKRIKDEHAELRKAKEEADRAQMSEVERVNADLDKERARADAAEARATKLEEDRAYDQQDSQVRRLASQHIAEDYVDAVSVIYARELNKKSAQELEALDDRAIGAWFSDFVKKQPAFGRQTGSPAAPKPPVKKPVTTGAKPGETPPANPVATAGMKDIRPGRPNSMTRPEAASAARAKGYSW